MIDTRFAAALAEAVEGSLHLADPLGDRGERVRDRALGVVVYVDPERRTHVLLHFGDHRHELRGQRPPVGVAQDEPVGAGGFRRAQRRQRVVAVGAEAVEEMLGVEEHLVHPGPQERDRVADHREILGEGRAERLGHVEVPRLADDRRHRRAGIEQCLHVRVRLRSGPGATGHAERGELRVLERDVLHATEESKILRVRTRPPALDVLDAQRVEPSRDLQLVVHRER